MFWFIHNVAWIFNLGSGRACCLDGTLLRCGQIPSSVFTPIGFHTDDSFWLMYLLVYQPKCSARQWINGTVLVLCRWFSSCLLFKALKCFSWTMPNDTLQIQLKVEKVPFRNQEGSWLKSSSARSTGKRVTRLSSALSNFRKQAQPTDKTPQAAWPCCLFKWLDDCLKLCLLDSSTQRYVKCFCQH